MLASCAPSNSAASTSSLKSTSTTTLGPLVPFKIGSFTPANQKCPANSSCMFPPAGYPGICKALPQPTSAIISEGQPNDLIPPGESLGGGSNVPVPKTVTNKNRLVSLFRASCQLFPLFQPFIGHMCQIDTGWVYQVVFTVNNRAYARVSIETVLCNGNQFADKYGIYWAFPNGQDPDFMELQASVAKALDIPVKTLFKS